MPTDDYARAKGWHIHRQPTNSLLAGEQVWTELALCPGHAGNSPRVKPQPLEGEQPLW